MDPKLIAAFRRSAIRAYPNEHIEVLRGRVVGDTATVAALVSIDHRSTEAQVDFHRSDVVTVEAFLGTIHSHCGEEGGNYDSAPSSADWHDAFTSGEIVFGVMLVEKTAKGRFKTSVEFWQSRPPIEVVYPRVRGKRKEGKMEKESIETLPTPPSPEVKN